MLAIQAPVPVRRFLERRTGWEILLLSGDAPTGHHAELLAGRRVNFASWPIPVDALQGLLERPLAAVDSRLPSHISEGEAEPGWGDPMEKDLGVFDEASPDLPNSEAFPPVEEQLREIETILHPYPSASAGPSASADPPASDRGLHPADWLSSQESHPAESQIQRSTQAQVEAPKGETSLLEQTLSIGLSPEELEAFHALDFEADDELFASLAEPKEPDSRLARDPSASASALAEAPSWYRSQVADLADLAQRLQLDSLALREAGGAAAGASDVWLALEEDIQRLGQFARTLGFVAAPPPAGDQVIDLGVFLQELVASILSTTGEGAAPKVLFRCSEPLPVLADKALLGAALDAMAQLAMHCLTAKEHAGSHAGSPGSGELRVRGEVQDQQAVLDMEFHAGPLGPEEPAQAERPRPSLLEPYALRRVFPDYGANALAAAQGILAGQGGDLSIFDRPGQRLGLVARLPLKS